MAFGRAKKQAAPLTEPALHEYALKSLGHRMRSEWDLRRLMRAKVEPDEGGAAKVDAVVVRLKEYGYLNDAVFAENYAQLRQQNDKLGERRVRQDLGQKGVSREIVAETIEARYADVSEEALAREHLERRRVRQPANDKETARVLRLLVRAGFSVGVIYKILRQWDVPEEVLVGLEGLDLGEE